MHSPYMSPPDQQLLDIPFSSDIRSSDWFYMKRFLAELQRELAEGKRYYLKIVGGWCQAYDMLRAYEDAILLHGEPSQAERRFFMGNLAVIKGFGIHILNIVESGNLEIPKEMGISLKDLVAMVEELGAMEKAYTLAPMKYERFKELWIALVKNRPSTIPAGGSTALHNGASEATLRAFAAYGEGDTSAIDALEPHFQSRVRGN